MNNNDSTRALVEEAKGLERALLICAPSHQGGHSDSGRAIADALGLPFPLTMDTLRPAAIERGFMPYDLWPWLERLEAKSLKSIGRGGDG